MATLTLNFIILFLFLALFSLLHKFSDLGSPVNKESISDEPIINWNNIILIKTYIRDVAKSRLPNNFAVWRTIYLFIYHQLKFHQKRI